MIKLTCPKCSSDVEIEDQELKTTKVTGVFCKDEECFFHKNSLIGIDRNGHDGQPAGVYISESIV